MTVFRQYFTINLVTFSEACTVKLIYDFSNDMGSLCSSVFQTFFSRTIVTTFNMYAYRWVLQTSMPTSSKPVFPDVSLWKLQISQLILL